MSALSGISGLFELGTIVATRGVAETCTVDYLTECLLRHVQGDWGAVCAADAQANRWAMLSGGSIMSVYPLEPSEPRTALGDSFLWIITEADRSVTTFLLPSEY